MMATVIINSSRVNPRCDLSAPGLLLKVNFIILYLLMPSRSNQLTSRTICGLGLLVDTHISRKP